MEFASSTRANILMDERFLTVSLALLHKACTYSNRRDGNHGLYII
jgi:hypothetical protein